ncbi:CRISPR-associated endonuclease Cas2 [uncultured Gimesia sp.]|uniref:CRISPR-associated endonuclease Cas2 n=1 Tax=uncultured Gimesia sp. TaxID=1678688 RepID=UPI0030DC865D
MFDLPTDTKKARRQYTLFRKLLLEDGFDMMQYSIYSRHCTSEEKANVHIRRIEQNIPPDGEVRILSVTDKQFEKMRIFWGKMRKPTNKPPRQLEFF